MSMPSPLRITRRRSRRAFTLIELLVAITAGLFVAMGAFSFAKASTRLFQQESRSASATTSVVFGFKRLVADLERAGFLSSPNLQREFLYGNNVCVKPENNMPLGIQQLASLRVEQGGAYAPSPGASPVDPDNDLAPDRITLAGSYTSTESFPYRTIVGNSPSQITLQGGSGALTRTLQGAVGEKATEILAGSDTQPGIFAANRIVRLVDTEGWQHFGVIDSVQVNGTVPVITLKSTPKIYLREMGPEGASANPNCRGIPVGTGGTLNVINIVRYEVRQLSTNPNFSDLYNQTTKIAANGATVATVGEPSDQGNRFELVRVELDADGSEIEATTELVAEYAIDLKVGVSVATQTPLGTTVGPMVQTYDVGHSESYSSLTGIPSVASPGPERVKALRVRLAVRSRDADRASDLDQLLPAFKPTQLGDLPGGRYRYRTPNNAFARVKTLQADVSLMNQAGVFW